MLVCPKCLTRKKALKIVGEAYRLLKIKNETYQILLKIDAADTKKINEKNAQLRAMRCCGNCRFYKFVKLRKPAWINHCCCLPNKQQIPKEPDESCDKWAPKERK